MLGMPELIIILVIAFLVFGAGKLPEVGSSVGRAIRDFRRATAGTDDEPDDESEKAAAPREKLPSGQASSTQPADKSTEESQKS